MEAGETGEQMAVGGAPMSVVGGEKDSNLASSILPDDRDFTWVWLVLAGLFALYYYYKNYWGRPLTVGGRLGSSSEDRATLRRRQAAAAAERLQTTETEDASKATTAAAATSKKKSKKTSSISVKQQKDAAPTSSTKETQPTVTKVSSESSLDDKATPSDEFQKKSNKKKRSKPVALAPQVFCEALSSILKRPVKIRPNPQAGIWGGQGWLERTSSAYPFAPLELDLSDLDSIQEKNETHSKENDVSLTHWKTLETGWKQHVWPQLQPVLTNWNVAAKAYGAAQGLKNTQNGHLKIGLDLLQDSLLQCSVLPPLQEDREDFLQHQDDEDDDEDVNLLFRDEETVTSSTTQLMLEDSQRGLNLLCNWLQQASHPPPRCLVEALPHAIAMALLQRLLLRCQNSLSSRPFLPLEFQQRVQAIGTLVAMNNASRSMWLRAVWTERIQQEVATAVVSGRTWQEQSWLQPLFQAVAFTVPEAGVEEPRPSGGNETTDDPPFAQQLQELPEYPLCVYKSNLGNDVIHQAQLAMRAARGVAEAMLKVCLVANKTAALDWFRMTIRNNEALVNLLKTDLLASDGIVATSSTRGFLLGACSTLVGFCGRSLRDRFDKLGHEAIDYRYLLPDSKTMRNGLSDASSAQPMIRAAAVQDKTSLPSKFGGATEIFFITVALFRVGLYPALRMEDEFQRKYLQVFKALEQQAKREAGTDLLAVMSVRPVVSAQLGWTAFWDEAEFSTHVTEFALLQLRWLLSVAQSSYASEALAVIPDWMCKEPARWLAHLAYTAPKRLKPHHATLAVELVTELLALDCSGSFSPIVVAELIGIVSAFVQFGVRLARNRKRTGGGLYHRSNSEDGDDRNLEVYLSFAKEDLGVTVFTNKLVCSRLCPTLMHTYQATDSVEGLDADKEHTYDKYSVKSIIADLLLRFWGHPNGECKASILSRPSEEIVAFLKSVATAAKSFLEDGLQKWKNTCKTLKQEYVDRNDRMFVAHYCKHAASDFFMTRRLLLVMRTFSEVDSIASAIGGMENTHDFATMVVHLIDLMTVSDGGTHPDLEVSISEPTSSMLQREEVMSTAEKEEMTHTIMAGRIYARKETGMDISILCHYLLALAARWHLAALEAMGGQSRVSPFISALVNDEDCDPSHLKNVFKRLVVVPRDIRGSEVKNSTAVFKHDGYVDYTIWLQNYSNEDLMKPSGGNSRNASQDQATHEQLEKVAPNDEIWVFLEDLEKAMNMSLATPNRAIRLEDIISTQDLLLKTGNEVGDEYYADSLGEWVVSSSPFTSTTDESKFAHYYDSAARTRTIGDAGKKLVKEARRCHKTLPSPHPNSSSFVCFAEERMDLCRGVVTGPVDAPYAHGLFVFDAFFPDTYPHIPPLVTFMTTGGGTTRFNANLYTDGKVCLSLLGVTLSWDESQKWNPEMSSFAQVLLSVQAQILVKDPFFNEGNGVPESMRHTQMGRERSAQYDNTLRLATLRYAVIAHLRSPPGGYEEIARRHFSMCRKRLIVQARRWTLEARKTTIYPRFERAYAELLTLLIPFKDENCLPPLVEDCAVVAELDPTFPLTDFVENELKPAAVSLQGGGMAMEPTFSEEEQATTTPTEPAVTTGTNEYSQHNPWASPPAENVGQKSDAATTDSDDELYL